MSENYREESRKNWRTDTLLPTKEEIQLGCLQRIADATEQMAKNYVALQNNLAYYQKSYRDETEYRRKLQRRIISLRGVITRQKKKLAEKSAS
jgi:hypothetical protein